MGFFDLNIPYHESDRHATDKPSLRGRRLKLALKAMELGFTAVAYNRTIKGVISESDRCSTTLFPISKLTPSSSSFFASVKFHRQILNVSVSAPFRQYTRLTVIVDSPSQSMALNAGNPILRSYDVVAVRPMNQTAFDQACQASEVDIIAIDFAEKLQLPFRLKQPMVKAAIKRGVYFEITYSSLILDAQSRRQTISNCKLLVEWTRGKNLVFCSAAASVTELRGPQDVANLFSLLGLPRELAKAAISSNCRSLLANALRKKHSYKDAIKVEGMPSGGQVNTAKSPLDYLVNWDPSDENLETQSEVDHGGFLQLPEGETSQLQDAPSLFVQQGNRLHEGEQVLATNISSSAVNNHAPPELSSVAGMSRRKGESAQQPSLKQSSSLKHRPFKRKHRK